MYEKLVQLCKERGVTLYRVAKEAGISTSSMAQWKNGISSPSIKSVMKIAAYYDVPLDYFADSPKRPSAPEPTTDHSHWVPVLGRVAAGVPEEMVEDIIDYEEINDSVGEAFALVINGDSMEPTLMKGDTVIVKRQEDVETGEVAIVSVNGEDATCKRIVKTEEGVMLVPVNPAYAPVFYSNEDISTLPVVILGRVVEIRRKL